MAVNPKCWNFCTSWGNHSSCSNVAWCLPTQKAPAVALLRSQAMATTRLPWFAKQTAFAAKLKPATQTTSSWLAPSTELPLGMTLMPRSYGASARWWKWVATSRCGNAHLMKQRPRLWETYSSPKQTPNTLCGKTSGAFATQTLNLQMTSQGWMPTPNCKWHIALKHTVARLRLKCLLGQGLFLRILQEGSIAAGGRPASSQFTVAVGRS